jgi:2-C-methyl-D-erythritol 4-phosphate cytidylyltransferase
MHMDDLLDLVMPAAGAGTRIGGVLPKHLLDLAGKPVFIHPLLVYERIPAIGRKVIVCQPDSAAVTAEALKRHGITNWELTDGGATRQESVRRGLDRVATDRVVIHNAAVALVTCDLIQNVIGIHEDCVTTATPLELNVVRGAEYAEAPVDRRELKVINTPQSARTAVIRECHARAVREGLSFSSESEMMLHFGRKVRLVPGSPQSFKITTPLDLVIAEALLRPPQAR